MNSKEIPESVIVRHNLKLGSQLFIIELAVTDGICQVLAPPQTKGFKSDGLDIYHVGTRNHVLINPKEIQNQ